jgi:hypothetical protein
MGPLHLRDEGVLFIVPLGFVRPNHRARTLGEASKKTTE